MKIINNRIFQILTVIILLIGVTITFNYLTKPVMVSDELTKGEFNKKMEDIEKEFTELKETIKALETNIETLEENTVKLNDDLAEANHKIESLKNYNKNLSDKLDKANDKIAKLNNDKELNDLDKRIKKMEVNEAYFYDLLYNKKYKAEYAIYAMTKKYYNVTE